MKFGVFAGITSTSLLFKGKGFDYLINSDFSSSVNFSAGVSVEVILPRNFKKWSLFNEIQYTSYDFNTVYVDFESENRNTTTTIEIGYSYLKMNNLVRYVLSDKKVDIFMNGRITNGISINEENYRKEDIVLFTSERTRIGKALDVTSSWEIGLALGVGLKYKKFSFEMRYERGNGMSRFIDLNSTTEKISFLLGYQF